MARVNITTTFQFQNLLPSISPVEISPLRIIVVSSDSFLEFCSRSSAVERIVSEINVVLLWAGVPQRSFITNNEFCLFFFATTITLLVYYFVLGRSHDKRRKLLAEDLRLAELKVHYLEEKLILAKTDEMRMDRDAKPDKPIRIFMDGAFDMMHYGHMNAFRLARSLGTHLIVGVNSDDTIIKCNGEPLMKDQERLTMVQGCKFVDEVVPGCPYVMNSDYLDHVIKKYDVDYVIHGDDPCIVDGKDVYAAAKARGKYQSIPRTEGVSTTDIIGRMLLMSTDHHYKSKAENDGNGPLSPMRNNPRLQENNNELLGQQSKFLTTSRMLRLFSSEVKNPSKDMKVIYMDGAWDMFHPGHVAILKQAKQRGDYLIVGIHSDATVNRQRGFNMPVMNLHERVLSVLGCRFVDDVLIDAPFTITRDMIASLGISEVVHGSRSDFDGKENLERYAVAKEAGVFKTIDSPTDFSLGHILSRIKQNHSVFQAKFDRKKKQEDEYYDERYGKKSKSVD